MRVWAVLAVALVFATPIGSARADTVNHCIDSCIDTYNGENQWEQQQSCVNDCRNQVNYGAIAYSESAGVWGYSYDYHNADDANRRALSNCTRQGAGCKIVINFSETCAALAAGDNNRFAAKIGDGAGDAGGQALNACGRNGGKNCAIKVATCARD